MFHGLALIPFAPFSRFLTLSRDFDYRGRQDCSGENDQANLANGKGGWKNDLPTVNQSASTKAAYENHFRFAVNSHGLQL
jgi:hypothetical protein